MSHILYWHAAVCRTPLYTSICVVVLLVLLSICFRRCWSSLDLRSFWHLLLSYLIGRFAALPTSLYYIGTASLWNFVQVCFSTSPSSLFFNPMLYNLSGRTCENVSISILKNMNVWHTKTYLFVRLLKLSIHRTKKVMVHFFSLKYAGELWIIALRIEEGLK